jgi:hypothetical protein
VVKIFVIFSGYAATRHFLTGTQYSVTNAKVATITASKMTMKELAGQSARGAGTAVKSKVGRTLILVGLLLDTLEYRAQDESKREVEDLLAKYTVTVGGAILIGALEPVIAAGVGTVVETMLTAMLPAAAAAVAVPIAVTVVVGRVVIGVGYLIGRELYNFGAEQGLADFFKKLEDDWHDFLAVYNLNDGEIQYFGP